MSSILSKIRWEPSSQARELARRYRYQPYMIERYLRMLGPEETIELLEAFENPERISPAIRCNNNIVRCDELISRLRALGYRLEPIEWASYSYRVTSFIDEYHSPTLGSTHEYLKGYYYLYRDQSPLVPPSILDISRDSVILDTCAAPGGKSIYMALEAREGYVISNDISRSRLRALVSHLMRMAIDNVIVMNHDARNLDNRLRNVLFARVLVDVPCSAEGYIMFDPSRKRKTDFDTLKKIAYREIDILVGSLRLLDSGGYAVYSTCSIAPEENEAVVSEILDIFGEKLRIVEPKINMWDRGITSIDRFEFNPDVEKCIRIWPHKHLMGGFFACLIEMV